MCMGERGTCRMRAAMAIASIRTERAVRQTRQ
jgi:hypothetical protein